MQTQIQLACMAFAVMIAAAPVARAQQAQSNSDMSNMPGMTKAPSKSKTDAISGTDMQSMMKQCGNMRKQMKSGAAMTPDMQKMMSQCDEMDKSMTAPEQPYTPPVDRRR